MTSLEVPVIAGLMGLSLALLERGYKRFLDEKAERPDLKFGLSYLINMLVAGGGSAVLVGVLPALLTQLGDMPTEFSIVILGQQFLLGYLTAYRALDGLNNRTDDKIELARKLEGLSGPANTGTGGGPVQ